MCGFNIYPESQVTSNCVQEAWSGHVVQDAGRGIGINGGNGHGGFSASGLFVDEIVLFVEQASSAVCLDNTSSRARLVLLPLSQ